MTKENIKKYLPSKTAHRFTQFEESKDERME